MAAPRRLDEQGAFLLGPFARPASPRQAASPRERPALQVSGRAGALRLPGRGQASPTRGRPWTRRREPSAPSSRPGWRRPKPRWSTPWGRYASPAAPRVTLLRRALPGGAGHPAPGASGPGRRRPAGAGAEREGALAPRVSSSTRPVTTPSVSRPVCTPTRGSPMSAPGPPPVEWRALLSGEAPRVLPLRGVIPFLVPTPDGQALVRLRCRGPVLELEWEAGDDLPLHPHSRSRPSGPPAPFSACSCPVCSSSSSARAEAGADRTLQGVGGDRARNRWPPPGRLNPMGTQARLDTPRMVRGTYRATPVGELPGNRQQLQIGLSVTGGVVR